MAGVSAGHVRLPIPDWLAKNEDYITQRSKKDAKYSWTGNPEIPAEVWQEAAELQKQPQLMELMESDIMKFGGSVLLPHSQRMKVWMEKAKQAAARETSTEPTKAAILKKMRAHAKAKAKEYQVLCARLIMHSLY